LKGEKIRENKEGGHCLISRLTDSGSGWEVIGLKENEYMFKTAPNLTERN